jgi:hypothetical protein
MLAGALAVAAIPALMLAGGTRGSAADHLDPPARTDPDVDTTPDKAADIADVYSWYTATDLVIAVTFAGPQSTSLPATYDRDVLYTINIANEREPVSPTFPIRVRFGRDGQAVGVKLEGVPGAGTMTGPVETNIEKNGVLARAGLFDDPFFFDLQGFRSTRTTGTLQFDNRRNFFAGQNLTAIVLQIPRRYVENGTNRMQIWADTARIGGQI